MTATTKKYRYDELSDEAKENAREWWIELRATNDWVEIGDHFKNSLEQFGFPIDDISWSLSYSQGDGMAFYGDIDLNELFEKHPNLKKDYGELFDSDGNPLASFVIARNHFGDHYSHYKTMEIETDFNFAKNKKQETMISNFAKTLLSLVRETSLQFAGEGYKIIEHYSLNETAEKEIREEEIRENECLFTKEGYRESTSYSNYITSIS